MIGDHRNDENLVVAQTHLMFLKFHNKVVDHLAAQGTPPATLFDEAVKHMRWHYQWMVLHDFVERITETGPDGAVAPQKGFGTATPLWYYILKEAQVRGGGLGLGAIGGRIVAEVFVGLVAGGKDSFLSQPGWTLSLPSKTPGTSLMTDLLQFVGEISPIDGITTVSTLLARKCASPDLSGEIFASLGPGRRPWLYGWGKNDDNRGMRWTCSYVRATSSVATPDVVAKARALRGEMLLRWMSRGDGHHAVLSRERM